MKKIVIARAKSLSTETVQGAALSLESIDNIERSDGLSLGVFGVGDGVSDDALKEGLQNTSSLLVDHCLIESASNPCTTRRMNAR